MNIEAFFEMGGYGEFVWSAFGLTLLLITIEIVVVRNQFKKVVQRVKRIQQLRKADSPGGQL